MHLRTLIPFLFAPAILLADQVVLINGDTITGSIVKKDGDKLTVKSEFLGEVSMPWKAVKSVQSDQDLTVVLPGNQTASGKVSTAGDTLQVGTGATAKSAPLADVAALRNPAEQHSWERLQRPGLRELWAGYYDLGLALTRGNARTLSFGNSFNATRVTRHDKIVLRFDEIYARATINGLNSVTANAIRGGWAYNRDLTPRFFVATLNDYEHDPFQSLDLRFVLGGGLGVNAVKSDRTVLSVSAGGDYERENFFNNVRRNSAELNFGDDLLYKVSGVTSVTQSARVFPNLSYTGEYRINFDLGVVTTVRKWLGWHVTASDRFLSNPLFGRQRNDLLLSTGFRLSFAR